MEMVMSLPGNCLKLRNCLEVMPWGVFKTKLNAMQQSTFKMEGKMLENRLKDPEPNYWAIYYLNEMKRKKTEEEKKAEEDRIKFYAEMVLSSIGKPFKMAKKREELQLPYVGYKEARKIYLEEYKYIL